MLPHISSPWKAVQAHRPRLQEGTSVFTQITGNFPRGSVSLKGTFSTSLTVEIKGKKAKQIKTVLTFTVLAAFHSSYS